MESLAIVVAIILSVSLFSGPIALILTWLPVLNRQSTSKAAALIRRILVTFFVVIGSLMSFNLFIASVGFAASFIAFIGSITAFFAVKREYYPNGFGIKFGGRSDRRNGPSGQH